MPNIPQYRNRIDGLDTRPIMRAADATADTARATASTYNLLGRQFAEGAGAVGDAVTTWEEERDKRKTVTEIAQATSVLSQRQLDLNTQYNEVINSSDPNVAEENGRKFLSEVWEPEAQRLMELATTDSARNYMANQINGWRQHMYSKFGADVTIKNNAATSQNLENSVLSSSNIVRSDWSAREIAVSNVRNSWNAVRTSGSMTPEQVAKGDEYIKGAEETIVLAGLEGMMEKDPARVRALIEGNDSSVAAISAAKRSDLVRASFTWENLLENQGKAAERIAKEKAETISSAAVEEYRTQFDPVAMADPEQQQATIQKIIQDPRVSEKDMGPLIGMVVRLGTLGDKYENDARYNQMLDQALAGKLSDADILAATGGVGGLSTTQANSLRITNKAPKTPEDKQAKELRTNYIKGAKNSLDRTGRNPQKISEFTIRFDEAIAANQAKGISPVESMNPASKDYIHPERIILEVKRKPSTRNAAAPGPAPIPDAEADAKMRELFGGK
tara:strand:+ start:11959 stop:13467 length:1509 start_codon:yes stop_codon:yes gene_type:complete